MINVRQRMKELISSNPGKNVFEIVEKDGTISWASDFILSTTGYTLDQISSMSLVNLSPDSLSSRVSSNISLSREMMKTSIWPIRTSSDSVSWWYVNKEAHDDYSGWYSAQLVSTTPKIGEDFWRMSILMDILNNQNDIGNRIDHHERVIENDITELKRSDKSITDALDSIRSQHKHMMSVVKSSANHSLEVSQLIKKLKREVEEGFSNQMAEILKLIQTDVIHDERINAFDNHMREVAENAMKSMKNTADATAEEFKSKAVEAGKGLTRKVTIPVSLVAAFMSGVQWIITHWDKLAPHFPHL